MTMLLVIPFAAATTLLNLIRGGAFGADGLPGHPRYAAAAAMALLALLVLPPLEAASFGVAFLAWSWLPWGQWFDLDRLPSGPVVARKPTWFEHAINVLPNDYVRFTVRNLIALIPAALLLGHPLVWVALAASQTVYYEAGWRLAPHMPIRIGEALTGATWGIVLLGIAHA